MFNPDVFPKRLKEARQKADLTLKALGEKVNVTSTTLSNYESNDIGKRKSPTIENAAAIADVLGVSLDWLCGIKNQTDEDDIDKKFANCADPKDFLRGYLLNYLELFAREEECVIEEDEIEYYDIEFEEKNTRVAAKITFGGTYCVKPLIAISKLLELKNSGILTEDIYLSSVKGVLNGFEPIVFPTLENDLPF